MLTVGVFRLYLLYSVVPFTEHRLGGGRSRLSICWLMWRRHQMAGVRQRAACAVWFSGKDITKGAQTQGHDIPAANRLERHDRKPLEKYWTESTYLLHKFPHTNPLIVQNEPTIACTYFTMGARRVIQTYGHITLALLFSNVRLPCSSSSGACAVEGEQWCGAVDAALVPPPVAILRATNGEQPTTAAVGWQWRAATPGGASAAGGLSNKMEAKSRLGFYALPWVFYAALHAIDCLYQFACCVAARSVYKWENGRIQ